MLDEGLTSRLFGASPNSHTPLSGSALAGLAEAKRRRRTGGELRNLTAKDVAVAKAMLAAGSLSSKEAAARYGVSKVTLPASSSACLLVRASRIVDGLSVAVARPAWRAGT